MSKKAFIFDLDGTLVDLRSIWEKTYNDLYQQEYGFRLTDAEMKSMFGPPELQCHENILKGRNLYTPAKTQKLVDKTEQTMLGTLAHTDVTASIIPEVLPCLKELHQRAGLAIATGNIESIARGIVHSAGLDKYFPIISFSSTERLERYQIVARAKWELDQYFGFSFSHWNTYVIGDSPSDISAASALGLHSVGVSTGHYSRQELEKERPEILISHLGELMRMLLS